MRERSRNKLSIRNDDRMEDRKSSVEEVFTHLSCNFTNWSIISASIAATAKEQTTPRCDK